MRPKYSRHGNLKEDFQFTEDHYALRHALTQKEGKVLPGFVYDRNCNQFAELFLEDKIGEVSKGIYEQKGEPNPYFETDQKKFSFDVEDDIIMVPVYSFGTDDLYVAVRGSEYLKYHIGSADFNRTHEDGKKRLFDSYSFNDKECLSSPVVISHVGKVNGDEPIKLGVNAKEARLFGTLPYTEHTFKSLIHIYMMQALTAALNQYYRSSSIDSVAFFDLMKLDMDVDEYYGDDENDDEHFCERMQKAITHGQMFIPDELVNLVADPDADMIIHLANGQYRMFSGYSNPMEDLEGRWTAWIRIPDTDIWQLINREQFKILKRIEHLRITYSQVDKPRFFDKVYYKTEHYASSVPEILTLIAVLTLDLDYTFFVNKLIKRRQVYSANRTMFEPVDQVEANGNFVDIYENLYEALTISVEQFGVTADVTLTQTELGMDNGMRIPKDYQNYRDYEKNAILNNPEGSRFRNEFCLLNLILDIAELQYSMNGGHSADKYRFF